MTKNDKNNLMRMNGMMKTTRMMSMMTFMELMMLAMMNPMVKIMMNILEK
jgi:hypothetical protein